LGFGETWRESLATRVGGRRVVVLPFDLEAIVSGSGDQIEHELVGDPADDDGDRSLLVRGVDLVRGVEVRGPVRGPMLVDQVREA